MAVLEFGILSKYAHRAMVDHVFGVSAHTPVSKVYLALLTQRPGPEDDGSTMRESTAAGYTRAEITFGAPTVEGDFQVRITQVGDVIFPAVTELMDGLTAWAVVDTPTPGTGNMLASGQLTANPVEAGEAAALEAGEIWIELGVGVSNYLAANLLNMLFRGQAYAQPSIYVGMMTAQVAGADDGSDVNEPSGSAYARQLASNWVADSSNWGEGVHNGDVISFPRLTADWSGEEIHGIFTADAATGGNLLYVANWSAAKNLYSYVQVDFDAGAMVWRHEVW